MTYANMIKKAALVGLIGFSSMTFAEDGKVAEPYGTAKFSSYADINQLKQL